MRSRVFWHVTSVLVLVGTVVAALTVWWVAVWWLLAAVAVAVWGAAHALVRAVR